MDILAFIKSWLEGEIKDDALNKQKKEVFSNEKELKQYKRIIDQSASMKVPKGRSKMDIWSDMQKKIETDSNKNKKLTIKHQVFYYSIASSIIIFLNIFFFVSYNSMKKIDVGAGQQEKIVLPDNSEVIINSVSKLSFSNSKWEKDRNVNLDGEALFTVKKGNSFTVSCANGTIMVKGTIFNVFSRGNILRVKCTEGSVSVKSIQGNTKLLSENQGVNFGMGENDGEIFCLDDSNSYLWTKGQFYFENAELNNIFSEIERQFNIKVQFKGKSSRFFTGYFNNKDLEQALKMVCSPMRLEYEIIDKSLVIVKDSMEMETNY